MSTFSQALQEVQNSNARLYPTKEEILNAITNNQPRVEARDIEVLNAWRKEHKGQPMTHETLTALILNLNAPLTIEGHNRQESVPMTVKVSHAYMYNMLTNTIFFGPNPSIISTLHEYAHALYGASELTACAWSIAMFKTVYPRSYAKLEWRGHMLKKPETEAIKPPTTD